MFRSSISILQEKYLVNPSDSNDDVILALIDIEKVTRLSPECCKELIVKDAHNILYTFISNHKFGELYQKEVQNSNFIKICINILINIAKYKETAIDILNPSNSIGTLSNLVILYQSSSRIFMDTCVLFILILKQEPLAKKLLSDKFFSQKIKHVYQNLSFNENKLQLNTRLYYESTGIEHVSNDAPYLNKDRVSFPSTPEWNLGKKEVIELISPLNAIKYTFERLSLNQTR